uniref:UBC core domain-containing protein n=1 Tax=Anas zonorhyncha TaxID=75864 RepID=A0A8B9V8S3_9AVES
QVGIQTGLEYLQRRRLHNLPGQPVPMLCHPHHEEVLSHVSAHIKFPIDYPYSPPTFRFLTKMWHPNIYENGDVCISILHPPVDDPQSGELPSERWNPTQNVRTILLSVISLLNEPNTFSPANVDASVMFRKWRDSKGKDKEYAEIIR